MQNSEKNTVSVFGLGYVGCVSIACLADAGHKVIGVDVKQVKIQQVKTGKATVFEPGLDDLMHSGMLSGLIDATDDVFFAIKNSDVAFITVGTPSRPDGELDFSAIFAVSKQIALALKVKNGFLTIAVRSTVKPGTCDEIAKLVEQHSGKKVGEDFAVVANPEFLREGKALEDYRKPPYVLIGAQDSKGANALVGLYEGYVNSDIKVITRSSAEIIKYINNSWHALKVAFGNEVGSVCKQLQIDSQEVMDVFCDDNILNISPTYLKPGFAYGGSCLPKDLLGFVTLANSHNVKVPMLEHVAQSNNAHLQRALAMIENSGSKCISFLGVTFKEGTDDLRNSPALDLVGQLLDKGYHVKVFDNDINNVLKNEINIESTLGLLGGVKDCLVSDIDALLQHSDTIAIAKRDKAALSQIQSRENLNVIDLVFVADDFSNCQSYEGLAW